MKHSVSILLFFIASVIALEYSPITHGLTPAVATTTAPIGGIYRAPDGSQATVCTDGTTGTIQSCGSGGGGGGIGGAYNGTATPTPLPAATTVPNVQVDKFQNLMFTESTFIPNTLPTLFVTNSNTCNPCSTAFSFIPVPTGGKSIYLKWMVITSSITQAIVLQEVTVACGTVAASIGPYFVTAGEQVYIDFSVFPAGDGICILPGASGGIGAHASAYVQ